MTIETPLLTAFIATAGAVLIAVIGLISSVHYRLGKVEEGQKTLAQEDVHNREMLAQEISQTRDMLTKEIAQTREIAAREDAHTRELITHTRELLMQEIVASRERSDAQHAETMAAINRLTDAFLSHSHDTDGTIRFSIPPPPAAQPE